MKIARNSLLVLSIPQIEIIYHSGESGEVFIYSVQKLLDNVFKYNQQSLCILWFLGVNTYFIIVLVSTQITINTIYCDFRELNQKNSIL